MYSTVDSGVSTVQNAFVDTPEPKGVYIPGHGLGGVAAFLTVKQTFLLERIRFGSLPWEMKAAVVAGWLDHQRFRKEPRVHMYATTYSYHHVG